MGSGARMTVVVTRSEAGDGPLTSMLEDRGARVLHWPTVRHDAPIDPSPLEYALTKLENYSWIVFGSPRTVAAVLRRQPVLPPALRVAAVGASTSASLEAAGWPVHLVPNAFTAEALVEAFGRAHCSEARVLFPAGDIARPTINQGLVGAGFRVDQVVAYSTVEVELDRQTCLTQVDQCQPGVVTFASPSAARSLHRTLGAEHFNRVLTAAPAIAIGPVTARALEEIGCPPAGIAHKHTLSGLVDAVETTVDRLQKTSRRLHNAVPNPSPPSSSP